MGKTALITGTTGQDGAYLSELLISKGYTVHGLKRRSSSFNTERVDHLYQDPHEKNPRFLLHYGDMTDSTNLIRLLQQIVPDEVYNLAAQSHVQVSFETPEYTANADALGTLRLLEAIRILGLGKKTRFYQASTSEMFGKVQETPQSETTPFYPRSPYGAAKVYGYWVARNYREAYGLYAVNGILFNHESPRRGKTFLTHKVTEAVARIKAGLQSEVYLGNLDARRDWGYAPEYVNAMWQMLQEPDPSDYVVGTGTDYSVEDFVGFAFGHAGLDWREHVRLDDRYLRPTEVDSLVGDATKAFDAFGWKATVLPEELARIMVDHDIAELEAGRHLVDIPQVAPWVS